MTELRLELLERRRLEIKRQMSVLRAEDEELAIAERVLRRIHDGAGSQRGGGPGSLKKAANDRANGVPRSQREYVLVALERSERPWITTRDLLALVEQEWGVSLPAMSVRPLLTVLRDEGAIVRDNRLVALARRVRSSKRA